MNFLLRLLISQEVVRQGKIIRLALNAAQILENVTELV